MKQKICIFWFRRDLRLEDNTGLFEALNGSLPVLPIFIFDPEILKELPEKDARVCFIHKRLQKLRNTLNAQYGSGIGLYYGTPKEVFRSLLETYEIGAVFTNHDYEPYAVKRDTQIKEWLTTRNIALHTYKDQVIFEKDEILKSDGTPYVVYSPYMRSWKAKFKGASGLAITPSEKYLNKLLKQTDIPNLSLSDIGFQASKITVEDYNISSDLINNYEATRNFPGIKEGTSRLGPHLRFGTISIRSAVAKALETANEVFWNELIWREFFMQILWHFPHTLSRAFKPRYDRIKWRNNEAEFEKWKAGETGYVLVDAGMRELNTTGFMHNRVRMLVASFLCKHLLIDWRWGEAYFAEKLLDYEMASNVGNWQWSAGSGVDAAPYFRIFNPMTQVEKFDQDRSYITKWIPELQELTYPQKMVDHKFARARCLKVYKEALG